MAGISGVGAGVISVGALLAYAGIRGDSPLTVLREIAKGNVSPIPAGAVTVNGAAPASVSTVSGGAFPELVNALQAFKGDTYSMTRRWDPGFSDCSSFVGKGLKSLGIEPPAGSTTPAYAAWTKLRSIQRSEVAAGDFLVRPGAPGHMTIAVDNTNAIGQQRPGVNVEVGPIAHLMFPSAFLCLRYTGPRPGGKNDESKQSVP